MSLILNNIDLYETGKTFKPFCKPNPPVEKGRASVLVLNRELRQNRNPGKAAPWKVFGYGRSWQYPFACCEATIQVTISHLLIACRNLHQSVLKV